MDITTPAAPTEEVEQFPWYSLNPRALKSSRIFHAILIGLLLACFSIVPVWRAGWYYPVYSAKAFFPMRDAHGRWRKAWQWCYGKEIRIYEGPGVQKRSGETIRQGVQAMVDEVKLDFKVKLLPMPPAILDAFTASTVKKMENGRPRTYVSFAALEKRLIEMREGDPHADILIVDAPMTEAWWAHGMATFGSGLGVMEDENVDFHLGKHETGHLLGYLNHDDMPLFVFGYPWEDFPWKRDTLMMLFSPSTELSPRSRDALNAFWRGLEHRTGRKFFR